MVDSPSWRSRFEGRCRPDLLDLLEEVPAFEFDAAVEAHVWVDKACPPAARAYLGLLDRYFLFTRLLGRKDAFDHGDKNRWLYDRCREVEADTDEHLDLWSRAHYKSSIITFAGTVQEILRDPDLTIAIFSHTRPIAKGFLAQIKTEFENNDALKALYPDVLWERPKTQAPRWSLDGGLIVKRKATAKEATLEAWGLVDGQPTSKHFGLRIYDDVATRENVTTPEQVQKTTQAWELSDNLGKKGGRRWHIGTRYSYGDTYQSILDRQILKPRVYPATHDGTLNGKPVFLSEQEWETKKRDQPSQIAAQMLQNPMAGEETMFRPEWLRGYEVRPHTLNIYILVDPSKGSPSRRSDRTAMAVIGVDAGENRYLLDGYRHRMALPERWRRLRELYTKWADAPGVQYVAVGYERYGLQSDLEHFELEMQREGPVFAIEEVAWTRDHAQSKADRVERLVPDMRDGSFFLPHCVADGGQTLAWNEEDGRIVRRPLKGMSRLARTIQDAAQGYRIAKPLKRLDENGQAYDLTSAFIEEALMFPFGSHDDLIDACGRLYDMEPRPPMILDRAAIEPPVFVDT